MVHIILDNHSKLPELSEEEKDEMFEQILEYHEGIASRIKDLKSYKRTNRKFTEDYPKLVKLYNNQMVAYYDNRYLAHARNVEEISKKLDSLGVPRNDCVIRYVTDGSRKFAP